MRSASKKDSIVSPKRFEVSFGVKRSIQLLLYGTMLELAGNFKPMPCVLISEIFPIGNKY